MVGGVEVCGRGGGEYRRGGDVGRSEVCRRVEMCGKE